MKLEKGKSVINEPFWKHPDNGEEIIMNNLDIAKKIIKEHIKEADCGIFNNRNIVGDPMFTIYNNGELIVDICYHYSYFEVFGLSKNEFEELEKFYTELRGW